MHHTIHVHGNADGDPGIHPHLKQKHLAFLYGKKALIRATGPLKDAYGAVKSGRWLVNVDAVEIGQSAQVIAKGQPLV